MWFNFQFLRSFPDPLLVSAFVVSQSENTLHVVSGLGVGGLCWAPTQSVLVGTPWALEGHAFCSWALCLRTLLQEVHGFDQILHSLADFFFLQISLFCQFLKEGC